MPVPLFASSLDPYLDRLERRIAGVARSGRYILGPEVEAFESEFAAYCGVRHCVGVGNGTDALTIALRSVGVQAGDEVVVPSFTFYASVEAAANMGAVPVFCDVDPRTFCVTRASVEAAITERTKAVIAVNLFGYLPPLDELRGLGVPVVEDAAQSHGALRDGRRAGSFGDAGTFSFFPSKNLGCLGDGGAIVTDSDDVAELARRLRFHGSRDKSTFSEVGYNSRLDAMQAAVLRELLPELDGWNERRRAAARMYADAGLGEHAELPEFDGDEHVFHLYVVRSDRADELERKLSEAGIGAKPYYRRPVHEQPAMQHLPTANRQLPATDEVARTHLALPMGRDLREDHVQSVVRALD